jgi:hypothetical protein
MANTGELASDRVVKKMTVVTPPRALVEAYLAAIAKTYNVMYNCKSVSHAQPSLASTARNFTWDGLSDSPSRYDAHPSIVLSRGNPNRMHSFGRSQFFCSATILLQTSNQSTHL